MDIKGNKVYLTLAEQRDSGYSSPIELDVFDLHNERQAADEKLDQLESFARSVDDDAYGRDAFHSEYKRAKSRSEITRSISKELARTALAQNGIEAIESFLRNEP